MSGAEHVIGCGWLSGGPCGCGAASSSPLAGKLDREQLAARKPLDYDQVARWVYDTCRLFGASPETSSEVAAIFCRCLRRDRGE